MVRFQINTLSVSITGTTANTGIIISLKNLGAPFTVIHLIADTLVLYLGTTFPVIVLLPSV